jgi:SAM-dependent methyltransferase
MSDYVFQTGEGGAPRLESVNEIFGAYSKACLSEAGLRPGIRVVEVGCGTGAMTSWIAGTVGEKGSVVAIDPDPRQIEAVRRNRKVACLGNVTLLVRGVPTDDLPAASFDLAYIRLVLMHLRDPEEALRSVIKTLRSGGTLVCEEATSSTAFSSPPFPVIMKVGTLFSALGKLVGADFDIGDRLFDLVRRRGGRIAAARFVQPMVTLPVASRFLELGATEARAVVVKAGLLTEADADGLLDDIRALAGQAHGYYAPARIAQVIATV